MSRSPRSPRAPFFALALTLAVTACDSTGADPREEVIEARGAAAPEVAAGDADADAELQAAAAAGRAAALDFKALHDTVEAHKAEIDACYQAAVAAQPGLSGRVVLVFAGVADGKARSIRAEEDTIGERVSTCVREAAAGWRLPPSLTVADELRYTLEFGPEGEAAARPANIAAAQVKVEGALDPEIIRRIVRAHINEVRHCYNEGLSRDPELAGELIAAFTITASGQITEAVKIAGPVEPEVDACVAGAIQRWRFPRPQGGGEVSVTYPFVLSPG